MCSGSSEVQKQSEQLEAAQTKMAETLDANYSTAFTEQQGVLAQQRAIANNIIANPQGLTPQEMATATTSINQNSAMAAKRAIGAAGAYAASHGGADVGSGAAGQIAGDIATSVAGGKAAELANLSNVNQAVKRQNLWQGIGLLSNTGSEYGSASGIGAEASGGVANSGTNAGNLALQAGQSTFGDILGGISGLAGLGLAGAKAYQDIKDA